MKQYLLLLLLPALLAITSCHKESHYTCVCSYRNDSLAFHSIGRMAKEDAYTKCKTYADSAASCYVEVRK